MEYDIKRDGGEITVWDKEENVGLRFYEEESLQYYTCAIVLPPWKELKAVDLERIDRVSKEILKWCQEKWPREFARLKA